MPDIDQLKAIFARTFPEAEIPDDFIELELGDIEEWDSLGNFNLLLAIEETFAIRLDMEEMSSLKSIRGFLDKLAAEGI